MLTAPSSQGMEPPAIPGRFSPVNTVTAQAGDTGIGTVTREPVGPQNPVPELLIILDGPDDPVEPRRDGVEFGWGSSARIVRSHFVSDDDLAVRA